MKPVEFFKIFSVVVFGLALAYTLWSVYQMVWFK